MNKNLLLNFIACAAVSTVLVACDSANKSNMVEIKAEQEASIEMPQSGELPLMTVELLDSKKRTLFLAPKSTTVESVTDGIKLTSSMMNPNSGGRTGATFRRVSEEFERMASEQLIRITITAKTDEMNPTSEFAVAYSTNKNGNSGWKMFTPTADYQDYSFEYKVPKMPDPTASELEGDFLGINADTSGSGLGLIVSSAKLEILK